MFNVYMRDPRNPPILIEWAIKNCPSFAGCKYVDVSDVSMTQDLILNFLFEDEQDVILFSLRWQ